MKDNLDIEKLFQEKFDSFEGDVSPDIWSNIQQNIGANTAVNSASTAATKSVSAIVKTAIIGTGIVAATVAGVYFFSDTDQSDLKNVETKTVFNIDDEQVSAETKTVQTNSADEGDLDNTEELEELEGVEEEGNRDLVNDSQEEITPNETNHPNDQTDVNNNNASDNGRDIGLETTVNNDEVNDQGEPLSDANEQHVNENDLTEDNSKEEQKEVLSPAANLSVVELHQGASNTYSFTANATNAEKIEWSFGDGKTGYGEQITHVYQKPGEYTVEMKVLGQGDPYIETQLITIEGTSRIENIPNVITPNNDHINDFLVIQTTDIATFAITIMDGNNRKVFESSNPNFRWYGTDLSGQEQLPKGIYYYSLFAQGTDGKEFKLSGSVEIR